MIYHETWKAVRLLPAEHGIDLTSDAFRANEHAQATARGLL